MHGEGRECCTEDAGIGCNEANKDIQPYGYHPRDYIKKYHSQIFIAELARAISEGARPQILEILKRHTLAQTELYDDNGRIEKGKSSLFRFLQELYLETISEIKWDTPDADEQYRSQKDKLLRRYHPLLAVEMPQTFRLVQTALETLPNVVHGRVRTNVFSPVFSWIGTETPSDRSGRFALVLSSGAAKGVFYIGFLRALQEKGLWPDLVVGSSAGAIAAAAMGTGQDAATIKKVFSISALRRIFHPLSAFSTLLLSLGQGIIGHGLVRHLKKVFDKLRFSELADVFIIHTIQQPFGFGKAVVGRASSLNKDLKLGTDIPVWKAVAGSCAIQGIVPPVGVRDFRAERLSQGEAGAVLNAVDLRHAMLEDGGVVEYLPILTADLLLQRMGEENPLIVAVNLKNLNPLRTEPREGLLFRERLRAEQELIENRHWYHWPLVLLRTSAGWSRQHVQRFFYSLAPLRAFGAYEAASTHNISQTVNLVRGRGNTLLLNPNANGSLDEISLGSFKNADALEEYGYETGVRLTHLLLGDEKELPDS